MNQHTKYDVYGIGNALVDTEYEVDEEFIRLAGLNKGLMTLIDSEERARLIHLLEEEHEHQVIKLAGGGSAANTIVIIAQLGGNTFYSCKVANDRTGDFFVDDLIAAGVHTNLSTERESGITGECISMVTPDAERTMYTHLGITQNLSVSEISGEALRNSRFLYIEGYLVSSPSGFEAALEAQSIARNAGVQVTLTLSDPAMVENFPEQFRELMNRGVDILFCNEEEARLWTGTSGRLDAAKDISKQCSGYAITCGGEGALVSGPDGPILVPGVPVTPVDTTGAGDIFAGTFLFALSRGKTFDSAAALANRSASLLVSSFGARLGADLVASRLLPEL